jgi:hypothetical protein
VEDTPGFSDHWNAVLRLLDDAIRKIADTVNILDSVSDAEPLALEAKRLEAEVSLFGIQIRRARAGLK